MRLGYSLLLGEHVAAEDVGYGDCAAFQIVCPSCGEALLKRIRRNPTLNHHLAHFPTTQSHASKCELRVAGASSSQMATADAIGRGQQLAIFQRVFRPYFAREIAMMEPALNAEAITQHASIMLRRASYRQFCRAVRDYLRTADPATLDEYWNISTDSLAAMSPFRRRRQEGFAHDFFSHLLAPNSLQSLAFAISLASLVFEFKLRIDTTAPTGLTRDVFVATLKIILHGTDKALGGFLERCREPDIRTTLESLLRGLAGSIIFTLMCLPYLDMLKDGRTS
jgi:hypothetical protein